MQIVERKVSSATGARKLMCIAISTNTTKFYLGSLFEIPRRSVPTDPAQCRHLHAPDAAERSWIRIFLTGELTDLISR